jgi:hypothetical protein
MFSYFSAKLLKKVAGALNVQQTFSHVYTPEDGQIGPKHAA